MVKKEKRKEEKIDTFYFMIHPATWASFPDGMPSEYQNSTGTDALSWYSAARWEEDVNRKQLEFIRQMDDTSALVIFPGGPNPPMDALIECGRSVLGNRCIVIEYQASAVPQEIYGLERPIWSFVHDSTIAEVDRFWEHVPQRYREHLRSEISNGCNKTGYDWSPDALKVVVTSFLFAREIEDKMASQQLTCSPKTVRAEAFGEGFEQCAMTWKAMIPSFLGWQNPVENRFDLSVCGAPILFDATLKERIELDSDVRLFLWAKSHGIPLALFAMAQARLGDKPLYVHIAIENVVIEVHGIREKKWPLCDTEIDDSTTDASAIHETDGILTVPVFTALRKVNQNDELCYLAGVSLEYAEFRDLLVSSRID